MRKLQGTAVAVVGVLVFALSNAARAAPATTIAGVKILTTEQVKGMLDRKTEMVLVNALSAVEFRDKTIPGSINVPVELWEEGRVSMPAPKEALLVFF